MRDVLGPARLAAARAGLERLVPRVVAHDAARAGNRGASTAFVNQKNSNLAVELMALLEEAGQELPEWLPNLIPRHGGGADGRPPVRSERSGILWQIGSSHDGYGTG